MSRAFVREDAGGPERLPDRPVPPGPNRVTPSGLAQLRARHAARTADLAALRAREDRTDRSPEAAAERDLRYLDARLAAALLVEPPEGPEEVAFGVTVTVEDDAGRRRAWRLVGDDEADPAKGWITPAAPLARALMGLRLGEEAEWRGGSLRVVGLSAESP